MRRLAPYVFRSLVALVAVLVLPISSARAQEDPGVRLTLLSQTPWNGSVPDGPGRELEVQFRAENLGGEPITDLSIGVTLYSRLLSRTAFEDSLTTDTGFPLDAETLPREGEIAPGQTRDFELRFAMDSPGIAATQSGVYPLKIDLRSANTSLAALRTPAIYLVRRPETPLHLSWTFVLHQPIGFGPDGVFASPELEASVSDAGRLSEQLAAIGGLAGEGSNVALDLVVSPTLLNQLARMQDGYRVLDGDDVREVGAGEGPAAAAGRVLGELRALASAPNLRVSAMPFSAPEIPALVSGGLTRDVGIQLERGVAVVRTLMESSPTTDILRPPGAALDDASLRELGAAGISTLIVGPSTVPAPEEDPLGFAGPPTAALAEGSMSAIVPDPAITALLRSTLFREDPVLAAQAVLGELASIWQQQPGLERGVAIVLSEDLDMPAPFYRPFANGVASAPWLDTMHAAEFLDAFPPGEPTTLSGEGSRSFASAYVEQLRQARRRVGVYRSMLAEPSGTPDRYDTMLLLAESRQFLSDPTAGLAFIASVRDGVGSVFESVTVDAPPVITLTSNTGGSVPVTVRNGGDEAVRVGLTLVSQHLLGPESRELALGPGEAQLVTFEVDSRSTGRFTVDLRVAAPSGRVIEEQTFRVRSTEYNRVALVITIAAAVLLMGLWGRRFLPRASHAAARMPGPAGPPSGSLADRVRATPPPEEDPPDPPTAAAPPDDSSQAFVRNTAVMSVGTAFSRLTGFLRLAAMAYAIGIAETRLADAYNIANITPNIIYELALGGILTSVVVPVFVQWLQTHGREAAWDVARRLFTLVLVVLTGLVILGILLAPWIVDLYTSGMPASDRTAVRELSTFFLRWFMPQIAFYGLGAVAIGLLNAHRRFAAPMFAPILNNLIVIATFLTFAAMPGPSGPGELATGAQRLVLAIGTTAGVVGMTVVLWPSLRPTGFRFAWIGRWRHQAIGTIARLATWVFAYVAANQLGYLVVIVLAGREQGSYTAYVSAFVLFQLPHSIFAVSIFTALLPAMSGLWSAGDVAGFRRLLTQGLRATIAIVLPAALGYLALSRPIVRLLLEHGVAGPESGRLVADVLVAFSLGLLPFSAFQLLLRAYYSMQDTRTPALVNVAAVVVNIVADLVLFFGLGLGVQGLALGHAISYAFGSAVLIALIRRRLTGIEGGRVLDGLWRTLIAGAATAGVAWLVARLLGDAMGTLSLTAQAVQVFGAVAAGLLVFVVAAALLRIEEVQMVQRQLLARVRR